MDFTGIIISVATSLITAGIMGLVVHWARSKSNDATLSMRLAQVEGKVDGLVTQLTQMSIDFAKEEGARHEREKAAAGQAGWMKEMDRRIHQLEQGE